MCIILFQIAEGGCDKSNGLIFFFFLVQIMKRHIRLPDPSKFKRFLVFFLGSVNFRGLKMEIRTFWVLLTARARMKKYKMAGLENYTFQPSSRQSPTLRLHLRSSTRYQTFPLLCQHSASPPSLRALMGLFGAR